MNEVAIEQVRVFNQVDSIAPRLPHFMCHSQAIWLANLEPDSSAGMPYCTLIPCSGSSTESVSTVVDFLQNQAYPRVCLETVDTFEIEADAAPRLALVNDGVERCLDQ